MGTTSEKLTYLNTTKTKIKEAINITGANITNETFRAYETKLKNSLVDIWTNGGDVIWNNWQNKATGTGEAITLNNTIQAKMKLDLLGNTSQSGTPSPESPQPISVVSGNNSINICGKNLFDKDSATYQDSKFKNNNGVEQNSSTSGYTTSYIEVKSNTTYTINGTFKKNNTTVCIYFYDNEKTWISRSAWETGLLPPFTFTTPSNCKYIQFQYTMEVYDANTIQIEEGTSATTYEPYTGQTYSINLGTTELCKIGDYKDSIFYNTTDTNLDLNSWYIKKEIGKVVLDGSESGWGYGAFGNYYRGNINVSGIVNNNSQNDTNLYSNYFYGDVGAMTSTQAQVGMMCHYRNSEAIYFISDETTSTNWKNWLSTHNTSVYYRLNTPTYTKITDTTLIGQLEATKISYLGETNISQVNNDKPFIINASAMM